jgi:hypothetical protein
MKTYPLRTASILMLMMFQACHSGEEIVIGDNHVKSLLHQKRWQVVALEAASVDSSVIQDWYAALPDCNKDNIFITQAPGTGVVGEIQAEEYTLRCTPGELRFHQHVAGWKLNEARDNFSVQLFDIGHRMLYGYELGASYHTENWHLEQLDDKTWQVRVPKVRDGAEYQVLIRFQSLPL